MLVLVLLWVCEYQIVALPYYKILLQKSNNNTNELLQYHDNNTKLVCGGSIKMKLQIEVNEYIKLIESRTELELMKENIHKDYNVSKL